MMSEATSSWGDSKRSDAAARTQQFRERYRQFVLASSPPVQANWGKVIFGIICCCFIVLLPWGILTIVRGLKGKRHARYEAELEFVDRAVAVLAAPLMVNMALRYSAEIGAYPGLFAISFDDSAMESMGSVVAVVHSLDPSNEKLASEDRQHLQQILADEDFQSGRRRAVPLHMTNGRQFYYVDMAVPNWYLPQKKLMDDLPLVACLAEPGLKGRIRVIPYWLVLDNTPPPLGPTPAYVGP